MLDESCCVLLLLVGEGAVAVVVVAVVVEVVVLLGSCCLLLADGFGARWWGEPVPPVATWRLGRGGNSHSGEKSAVS